MSRGNGEPEGRCIVLDWLAIEPDPAEILRYLGYPPGAVPEARIAGRMRRAIEASRGRLRPRAMYSLYGVVRRGPRSLALEGGTAFRGKIGEFLGAAERAAVFLATAGPEVVRMAEDAIRARDVLGGLVFDALGSQLAEAAVERVVEHLRGRLQPGEALTLRYSPGYCGISLSQQRTIFRLIDGARIGVELLPSLFMKPIKSVSGLIGIGPAGAVIAYGNPCDRCPLTNCRMRR